MIFSRLTLFLFILAYSTGSYAGDGEDDALEKRRQAVPVHPTSRVNFISQSKEVCAEYFIDSADTPPLWVQVIIKEVYDIHQCHNGYKQLQAAFNLVPRPLVPYHTLQILMAIHRAHEKDVDPELFSRRLQKLPFTDDLGLRSSVARNLSHIQKADQEAFISEALEIFEVTKDPVNYIGKLEQLSNTYQGNSTPPSKPPHSF